jgi:hypothetical protein
LHDPHALVRADVVVEIEADLLGVESLRGVDVGNGNGNDFKSQVHAAAHGRAARVAAGSKRSPSWTMLVA